ncbi:MAG: hypothetical protein ACLGQH_09765 [Acidobacteriota bacterium]
MARNADNAILYMEAGQVAHAMAALTDSGDHTIFESGVEMWSKKAGYEPTIRPNGLVTGGVLSAKTGTNNAVQCAALTAYIGGVLKSVAANTSLSCPRATTNPFRIHSIVTDGSAISVVSGTEGSAFTDVRGAAGGPPLIAVNSIEIGQVRYSSLTAADVAATEIFQVIGTHQERYDYPTFQINYEDGTVICDSAVPTIHTGTLAKGIFAEFYEPVFSQIPEVSDFVPPETSHSVASKQIYGKTLGSASASLGQGSFTAYLEDGIGDPLIASKDQDLWFKFKPNRLASNYLRCLGKLGIKRTYPAGDNITAACTITATDAASEVTA